MAEGISSFDIGPAFSWASIGLAVFTAVLQGMVAALAFVTESSGQWTFRFRLARVEHHWWTFVAILLLTSLIMSAVAFISGRGGDPVSVLALSSATFLAVIQYALPAWQQRHFTKTRWYAWTGDSRTAIKREYAALCLDARSWKRLAAMTLSARATLQETPSDLYGWRLWPAHGLIPDPTDVFMVTTPPMRHALLDSEKAVPLVGVFEPLEESGETFSFLWGRKQQFKRRVSRAVISMPLSLLTSSPRTLDGYNGRGLAIAMGILGRNKGLQPWKLTFKSQPGLTRAMESSSTWTPRPAKVLRSFYQHAMKTQYDGLGQDYVDAATELALLLVDMPSHAVDEWLIAGLEHQSLAANNLLAAAVTAQERVHVLGANYEASYASMILSLNYMDPAMKNKSHKRYCRLDRPDIFCTALLCHARGMSLDCWDNAVIRTALKRELVSLQSAHVWKEQAALLLELKTWPAELDQLCI